MSSIAPIRQFWRCAQRAHKKSYSTSSTTSIPQTSPFAPRHLLSIADLSAAELTTLVKNAYLHKQVIKSGSIPSSVRGTLAGKSVALSFSKRSTRTRISTEGAVAAMGGHPMFLGKDDIQLGVNESLHDTSVVISSMVSSIVARVGPHSDIQDLAKHSSVPVINALSDLFHPMQTIADYLTIHEVFSSTEPQPPNQQSSPPSLGLEGLKIAWIGDANNVLYDLALGASKLGLKISIATPSDYKIPPQILTLIHQPPTHPAFTLTETCHPEEALHEADLVVTDTWVSMGQEAEKATRMRSFQGFQVTSDLVARGGAKPSWKFMHCLPRHEEEVSDEVFYSPRSLVFQEAENRLWAAIAVLEAFVVNKGRIV